MRMQLEGIKKKVLKIVIKIQWGRWNKIGRKFMVAEATWGFIVPFSLLFMCLKFLIIEMKDLLSLQSYQLRFEPHLIWRLALCLYSIVGFFSQMKKWLSGDPISQAFWILMFLSFHCFVKIWKQLALEFQGLTISYAQVKRIHFSSRLLCCHLSVIFPSCLSVDGIQ